jgi:hypothetical protein
MAAPVNPLTEQKKCERMKKNLPKAATFRLNSRNYFCNSNHTTQTMKRIALPLILAATMLTQVASAQSSTTPVIGYYKFDVPAQVSAWTCNFVTKKTFQGAMTGSAVGVPLPNTDPTAVITQTGAGWAVNSLAETVYNPGNPTTEAHVPKFYVELLSGSAEGRILDVISNTADTVRVAGVIPAGTTTYCIRAHNTLGKVFAGGAGLEAFSDNVQIFFGDGTSAIASYDGANWSDISGNLTWAPNDDLPIYPGQGFLITAADARVVTFGGGRTLKPAPHAQIFISPQN